MDYPDTTFVGPAIDDPVILKRLPAALRSALEQTNGFVAFSGGFHFRGACSQPDWHALRSAWEGPRSFASLYRYVLETDVPFAENALGDQFLLRDGVVWQLFAETGDLVSMSHDFGAFTRVVLNKPTETLQLEPLLQFAQEGGQLRPGQLLSVYPPFFAQESKARVSLRAIDAISRRVFLAELAEKVADLPDGAHITLRVVE